MEGISISCRRAPGESTNATVYYSLNGVENTITGNIAAGITIPEGATFVRWEADE
jgi:hypothetical protein